MAKTPLLDIGKTGSRRFTLPLEAVTETFAILAKRGAGKTYTGSVMAEELLAAHCQIVVMDPLDVWWGLRCDARGRPNGYPIIIFGGHKGDLPLTEHDAPAMVDLIVDENVSVVLSMSHMRKNEQRRFVTKFAELLFERKGKSTDRKPLHVLIDEADSFVPQRVHRGQERMLGAMEDIVRRGRSRGLGVTLITQRAAVINKDVLTQAEVLVAMRNTGPQDRKAIEAWVDVQADRSQAKKCLESLPSLPVGTAWFWSPGWLDVFCQVQVRKRRTFDSSDTPKSGGVARTPKKLAAVDLGKIKQRMADAVERQKSEDPRELRKRIRELERDLAKKAPQAAPQVDVGPYIAALESALKDMQNSRHHAAEIKNAAQVHAQAVAQRCEAIQKAIIGLQRGLPRRTSAKPLPIPAAPAKRSIPQGNGNGENLPRCQRAILTVLAQRAPKTSSKAQVSLLSGYSGKSSGFKNALSWLRTHGLMEGGSDALQSTPAGLEALGSYAPLPTGPELVDYWVRKNGRCAGAILRVLADRYPGTMSKDEVAEATEYSAGSSGFKNALSKLRTLELITRSVDISAREELFE